MKARIFRSTVWVAASLCLAAGTALADEEEIEHQWLDTSLYVQAAGSFAFEEFKSGIGGSNSLGFDLAAGLRITSWLAAEVQFDWSDGMDPHSANASKPGGVSWATTFNARAYPLTDYFMEGRIQPYLLAGIGASSFRTESGREVGFATRWGVGVDTYVTEKIALTVGASYLWSIGTPVRDLNYVSLNWGAMYRFY